MKKIIIGILAFCFFRPDTLSAHIITVSNNPISVGMYANLQTAVNSASAGDTVYVMGSPTDYGSVTISKSHITLIGAGYAVKGLQYNYNTIVDYVYLNGVVKGTKIQGLFVNNSIQQSGAAVVVDSVDVERCYVTSGLYVYGTAWTIRNNDINNVYIQNNTNCYIQNNFLEDIETSNQLTVVVDHNVFATYSGNALYTAISNATISNNVFYYSNPENGTTCVFNNNITSASSAINLNTYGGNSGGTANIFATPPGWTDATIPAATVSLNAVWNYNWTFTPASPAHHAATDGSDIGVYGGNYPMPNLTGYVAIPQITLLTVSAVVATGGSISVNFKGQGIMAHGVLSAEYFFDNDPGVGSGTPITFTGGDSVTVNQSISITALTSTFHVIGVRVKDSVGHWSLYSAGQFYVQPASSVSPAAQIVSAEYFFDKDPGQGKGTAITTGAAADSIIINQAISISSLPAGYHKMYIRSENAAGQWSLYEGRSFYIQPLVTIPPVTQIVAAEYFFDKDPGQGKGTAITTGAAADSIIINQAVSISSLPAGYHKMFIRSENAAGQWSLYEGRSFYIQPLVVIPPVTQIVAAEYFFDVDPGQGKGTAITTGVAADSIIINQAISISSLPTGYHKMYIRSENAAGQWSLYEGRSFYIQPLVTIPPVTQIVAAEYFFDKDPGQGKGIAIATGAAADSITMNNAYSIGSLTVGFHKVFVRAENAAGQWSLYEGRNFLVAPAISAPAATARIVAGEYFFDKDPGQGKGFAITGIVAADSISLTQSLNTSALSIGSHAAFIRVEDSTGHWSLYQGGAFKVQNCSDIVNASSTKDSCFGGNDGTATAFASGGAGKTYTYSWSTVPVQTTATATGLTAGVYTITVMDSIGCPATNTVVVGQPSQIKIKTSVVNTTCGQDNGQASVTSVTGGTGTTYTYAWSTVPVQTGTSITNLSPGTYTVTAYDKYNCSNTATVTVAASTSPVMSVASTTPSKCGQHIGSATVSVTGGTAPYRFGWNNGDTLSTADSLHSGNYIVTVTDKNGCSTFISIAITNSDGPVIKSNVINEVTCYGLANGSISTTINGGVSPYSYAWSNGATTSTISNLSSGPYYVTVTDNTGCSGIKTFTVTQPSAPVALTVSTTTSACSSPTGSASVVVSGGTSPYTYNWSSGASTTSAFGLIAGTYTVTVADSNGCMDSAQAAVSSLNGPVVTVDSTIASACASGNKGSGSVILTVTGGTGTDSYVWSDINNSTNQNLTNVPTGTYNVIVTDQVGCIGTATAKVQEKAPPQLPICMVTVDPKSNHNYVVWDKSLAKSIASYNVYKETTVPGLFNKIGSVPVKNGGTYVDSLSDPDVQSWRYEISQVDSCGFESPLSSPHKTMHLTISQNGSTFNLIWDNYQGLPFNYYIVYRDTVAGVANDSVGYALNNGIYTYSNKPPASSKPYFYHMGISNPGGCTPSIESINYNASKSNTGNITVSGIAVLNGDLNSLVVYPNPSRGIVNFTLDIANKQNITMKVYNAIGQMMATTNYGKISGHISKEIDLSGLSKGVYILQVSGDSGNTYKKVVLQ